jgi:hypothetical protein
VNRFLAAAALAAFLGALVAIAISSTGGGDKHAATTIAQTTTRATTRPTTTAPQPRAQAVKLSAVGAYDPEGDGHENDDLATQAVDGDPATFWKTEHYTHGFFKKGVGLVLDAGRPRTISKVIVSTDSAGSRALIQVGRNPNGPFRSVSAEQSLSGATTFTLAKGSAGRYVVVWITQLPQAIGEAHVTEVRAAGS